MNGDKLNDEIGSDPPNVDLMGLCEEGKVEQVVEYMGQGVCVDYGVFCALLGSCGDIKLVRGSMCSFEMFSVNLVKPGFSSFHQSSGLQIKGYEFVFLKLTRVSRDHSISFDSTLTGSTSLAGM